MNKLLAANDIPGVFGTINPPPEIKSLVQSSSNGAAGINTILNNIITLIYIVSAVVFVFMLLIGAFQWIASGGEKTKLEEAQKKITNALIGITLLAVAFAIIKVIGIFTGFTFFAVRPPGT